MSLADDAAYTDHTCTLNVTDVEVSFTVKER